MQHVRGLAGEFICPGWPALARRRPRLLWISIGEVAPLDRSGAAHTTRRTLANGRPARSFQPGLMVALPVLIAVIMMLVLLSMLLLLLHLVLVLFGRDRMLVRMLVPIGMMLVDPIGVMIVPPVAIMPLVILVEVAVAFSSRDDSRPIRDGSSTSSWDYSDATNRLRANRDRGRTRHSGRCLEAYPRR